MAAAQLEGYDLDVMGAECQGPSRASTASYFPDDGAEHHYSWHAAQLATLAERASDLQVQRWLGPRLESLRLRFLALHEQLDRGRPMTISDHHLRDLLECQREIDPYLDLAGNPVDAALNHTMRRLGEPPMFGEIDRLLWRDILTAAEIRRGMRPSHKRALKEIGDYTWDPLDQRWNARPSEPFPEADDGVNAPDFGVHRQVHTRMDWVILGVLMLCVCLALTVALVVLPS